MEPEIKRFKIEDKNKGAKIAWWRDGMMLFMNLSGYVFGPLVIGYFLGTYIDNKFNSSPWAMVGASLLGFIFSTLGILFETIKYLKKVEKNKEK